MFSYAFKRFGFNFVEEKDTFVNANRFQQSFKIKHTTDHIEVINKLNGSLHKSAVFDVKINTHFHTCTLHSLY